MFSLTVYFIANAILLFQQHCLFLSLHCLALSPASSVWYKNPGIHFHLIIDRNKLFRVTSLFHLKVAHNKSKTKMRRFTIYFLDSIWKVYKIWNNDNFLKGATVLSINGPKHNHLALRGPRWICWTSKLDLAAQQGVNNFIEMIVIKLATPKARAKHDRLFNKLASEAWGGFVEHLSPP